MSNSSPLEQEQTSESDSTLNQEIPNLLDPPPKSDPETVPPSRNNIDLEYTIPEGEEEGEETEEGKQQQTPAISSGMSLRIDPPITGTHLSLSDTALTSPSGDTSTRRRAGKRKKGKGKTNVKKRQAIAEKFHTLTMNLMPIAFIPTRILDFANHENLLKKLGLWDFVHIDFDRRIRIDLVAQLVATYNPKLRASYVNDYRIMVNRADLARAFKLPLKKERGSVSGTEVDLEAEALSEDSIGFMVDFMSEWVLLHEDTWMMPNEVADWLKLIKDGHPEKVDWAGLLWFMVEKELKQGGRLTDCYYASHLQHLIKFQREGMILRQLPRAEELEVDGEADVENDVHVENFNVVGSFATPLEEDPIVGGPSTELTLTLGQDGEKEDKTKDGEKEDETKDGEKEDETKDGEKEDETKDGEKEDETKDDEKEDETKDDEKEDEMKDDEKEDGTKDGEKEDGTKGGEKEDGMKDVEMMDAEKSKESDEEGGEEEQGGEEDQRQWLLNGKNDLGEHIMQRCSVVNTEEFSSFEFRKDDEEEMDGEEDDREEEMDGEEDDREEEMDGEEDDREEEIDAEEDAEEAGNEFHVFTNDGALEGDGFTGNLLDGVEGNHMAFSSQDQLHDPSSMDVRDDMQHISSAPSFFNNSGKRVLEHDNGISHRSIDDSNKRLRINDSWDNKPLDFGMCMEQIVHYAEKAKVFFTDKEHTNVQQSMNQQILLDEVQKRDSVIEHLHKARLEEAQKKDREIFRLERELYLMGSVLDGYRKALKDVQKSFAEYRERANLSEESTYMDTGEGGLMLTAPELEKLRKKQEEEYKMKCLALEQNMKEVEEDLHDKFSVYVDKVNLLDKRLTGLEAESKELISLYAKRKIPPTEEKVAEVNMAEVSEPLPHLEPEENMAEVSEPLPNPESEENVTEVSEPLPNPKLEEKVPEVSEPLPNPELEEKVPEVPESPQVPEPEAKSPGASKPLQYPEADEKVPEVAEPLLNE
ncbi:hypothetical protein ACS0TY_031779 [Phlomoides rotata]